MMNNDPSTERSWPARQWHTASYTNEKLACVEVAEGPFTGVRDSKNRDLTSLFFPSGEWDSFLRAVKNDRL
ncbi:DUF397 domain-containing protein [Salinactinospora qingdaonensis]|uniref:DUF397 domain-containing protein n=1 Tax=Salinactinospora qingdaonensis TaxID=702744 RepID=A0ABP7FE44_9ACTN